MELAMAGEILGVLSCVCVASASYAHDHVSEWGEK